MKSFFAISLVSFLFFSAAQARVDRVIQIQATTENKSANERTVDRYSYNFGQVFTAIFSV